MGISSKLSEGRIYWLVKAALRMRRMQRQQGQLTFDAREAHNAEVDFDVQLERLLANIDQVDTNRVISAMNSVPS